MFALRIIRMNDIQNTTKYLKSFYIICHGICNELHFLSINNVVIALYPFWKGNTYFLYYTFLLIIVIEQSPCSELNFQIGIFTLHDRKRVNIKEMKRENINGSKQILFTYSLTYFWKWNNEKQEILFLIRFIYFCKPTSTNKFNK